MATRIRHDFAANEQIRAFSQGDAAASQQAADDSVTANRQFAHAWGEGAGSEGILATNQIRYQRDMEEVDQLNLDMLADSRTCDIQEHTAARAAQRCAPRG